MIVGCYTLDLYCECKNGREGGGTLGADKTKHFYGEFPHQFTGHDLAECKRQAGANGWVFTRDRECICPKCVKKGLRPIKEGES